MSRRSKERAGTGKERLYPLHKSRTTQVTASKARQGPLMSPGTPTLRPGLLAAYQCMGEKGDLSPCKKTEVKALVNAKLFSNREISRRLKVSEANLEEWFPNGKPYIFMQGGAPCQTARSIKAFLAEQNIQLLDWTGNSPDMNPIKNVWELMKREVAKDVITNKTQLLERIIHAWNHHP
ncbi:putative transposase like protein [Trichonephila clavipes]|uniref:Putative transposase like protein n=1 Tax=Trichonephila clavipes TaxID=2585209 RepID=A0A8X6S1W1_TRICX|nr:putative transposase like protein [Trichonephila clavipes]